MIIYDKIVSPCHVRIRGFEGGLGFTITHPNIVWRRRTSTNCCQINMQTRVKRLVDLECVSTFISLLFSLCCDYEFSSQNLFFEMHTIKKVWERHKCKTAKNISSKSKTGCRWSLKRRTHLKFAKSHHKSGADRGEEWEVSDPRGPLLVLRLWLA